MGNPYTLTDFYFGLGGLVDIFRKDAKEHFWSFYKKADGYRRSRLVGDLGEPEKHPSTIYHNLTGAGYKRLFSADEVHNAYGHNWTKMLYEKYSNEYPDRRLFSLNRSVLRVHSVMEFFHGVAMLAAVGVGYSTTANKCLG
jgi:oligosaccharide 4-alpha-D-glucosyltransferase